MFHRPVNEMLRLRCYNVHSLASLLKTQHKKFVLVNKVSGRLTPLAVVHMKNQFIGCLCFMSNYIFGGETSCECASSLGVPENGTKHVPEKRRLMLM